MTRRQLLSASLFGRLLAAERSAPPQTGEAVREWSLENDVLSVRFSHTSDGRFEFRGIARRGGSSWAAHGGGSSPIRLCVGERWLDKTTQYRVQGASEREVSPGRNRLTIVLELIDGSGQVTLDCDIWQRVPVLRYAVRYRNLAGQPVTVTAADLAAWEFEAADETYSALRVEQWLPTADPADFDPLERELDRNGQPVVLESGTHGRHCAWLALAGQQRQGLVLGLEFDGYAETFVRHWASLRNLAIRTEIAGGLNRVLEEGEEFAVPEAFLGVFDGDWDEAAFVTHGYVDAALAKPAPDGEFPYVMWDSWAYGQDIHENSLRRNADIAAQLGIEVFVVDLGWARRIGDWREDPAKFPSGLRALSDYVHRLGMKFGLHLAWVEADPQAPVLLDHPDWTTSTGYGYYGAQSLCLAHRNAREWVVEEVVRVIDEYGVDWILQDGEGMVKRCERSVHTHHAADSNLAAAEGLDMALSEIQRRRPRVLWENCENGGNIMTFNMVRHYATSIVNDASGAFGSRKGVYGATYPFPPRYADRYMPEEALTPYVTRSYLFGGPWIFMNPLEKLRREDLDLAASEVALYKRVRRVLPGAKVLHIAPPREGEIDAIAAWQPQTDTVVAVVTRDNAPQSSFDLRVRELTPGRSYRVAFATDPRVLTMTGDQIARSGVTVRLAAPQSAEVVTIEPL